MSDYRTFDWNTFAQEIHQNAVEHGWWETERPDYETIALIHSEWSEALEEYRAGRPMIWHYCSYNGGMCETQEVHQGQHDCANCTPEKRKPEGIAVELVDGVIRILDYIAHENMNITGPAIYAYMPFKTGETQLPKLITDLHECTARNTLQYENVGYIEAIALVCSYLEENGVDAIAVMKKKHEYNKTRPYKHGGKIC